MNAQPLRLLLDENFPGTPQGLVLEALDQSVTLTPFAAAFPQYVGRSTPDWKLYLLAKRGGFDAVVTDDWHQLTQDEEMVSLKFAEIGLITWNSGESDIVVKYGQLLAFMPQIVKQLRTRPVTVVKLPRAHLKAAEHFLKPDDITRRRDQRDGLNWPQRMGMALRLMRRDLSEHGEQDLLSLLPKGSE